jgi:hypothetical protein
MPRLSTLRLFCVVVVVLLAVGCGGGGGPSGPGRPVISSTAPPTGTTGVVYPSFTFSLASGGAAPFTWSQTGALPPGLAFSTSGQLSGTPGTAGTYPFTVMVSDSSTPPLTSALAVTLKIDDSPIVISPTPTPPAGIVGYAYAGCLFHVMSGGSPPFSWTVVVGTLPPGLTLGSDGSLSGTPTSTGSFKFTVTATDSASPAGTGSQSITVDINVPGPPMINPIPALPAATVGSGYQYQFAATGGYLPLRWAVTAGSLPLGLTLAANGLLSGIPTTVGSPAFTVTVTDSAPTPATNSAPFTIVVSNPPAPAIINASPPTATVGTPYSYQFQATDGLAPLVWSETGAMPSLALNFAGVLSGTPTGFGRFPIVVDVKDALGHSAPSAPVTIRISSQRPAIAFESTGGMKIARSGHTATLLNTGEVLVTGGADSTAELYNPATGTFIATMGSMTEARSYHTATLLNDSALVNYGKVLILGSVDASAELYDPASGTFSATHNMTTARTRPTATLLNTGKVLVVGGNTIAGASTAELYDPAAAAFTATGNMTEYRDGHTATLLVDGRVLVAGGVTTGNVKSATAELYDPTSGNFTATGMMKAAHSAHAAMRLQDGTVLIVDTDTSAELYDPGTGTFASVGNALTTAFGRTASLRKDGTVIATGGYSLEHLTVYHVFQGVCQGGFEDLPNANAVTALFAPESQGFTPAGSMRTPRDGGHTATVLPDGTVLIVGGTQHTIGTGGPSGCRTPTSLSTSLSSAELVK